MKTLSDKLSEALLNIRAKEDLVKQHAKVAEEAVSGMDHLHKPENKVTALSEQLVMAFIASINNAMDTKIQEKYRRKCMELFSHSSS